MSSDPSPHSDAPVTPLADLVAARREKLRRYRDKLKIEPFGQRVDGIEPITQARAKFDEQAHLEHDAAQKALKAAGEGVAPSTAPADRRAPVRIAGRVVQHRDLGKLVFLWLRDHTGDLQVSISKAGVPVAAFELAKNLDYGDIVVADGPIGRTQRGEVCVWADRVEIHGKALAPPPEKWHGLTDPELRYRHRYVDMFANPQTMRTVQLRTAMVSFVRRWMDGRGFLEVETPMMQSLAGGAAARPFVTHHNALDIDLFLRIAPELYLKRLLVGGLPRVYEINRNFRNEGIDRSHNPEFTMMEAYQAFGDCFTMLELTESLVHDTAVFMAAERARHGMNVGGAEPAGSHVRRGGPALSFGDRVIDYSKPFERVTYGALFERALGFPMTDFAKAREHARRHHIEEHKIDDWFVVNELFEEVAEPTLDPTRPTFILEYPSAISPLTRPNRERPELADRWDLFIAGMEIGPAYSELNDPDIQLAKFTEQLRGGDNEAEEQTFRSLDEDFLHALRVGMPPAGGLGLGIDRIAMLMTDSPTIRDVVLFPLMRP